MQLQRTDHPIEILAQMAEYFHKSGLFGISNPAQAIAIMLIAQAKGLHPAQAIEDYDFIKGKAVKKTEAMLRDFQKTGGKIIKWFEFSDNCVDALFCHPAGGELRVQWTMDMAKKAGLIDKDNWQKYPRAMLRNRCVNEAVSALFPGAADDLKPQAPMPTEVTLTHEPLERFLPPISEIDQTESDETPLEIPTGVYELSDQIPNSPQDIKGKLKFLITELSEILDESKDQVFKKLMENDAVLFDMIDRVNKPKQIGELRLAITKGVELINNLTPLNDAPAGEATDA